MTTKLKLHREDDQAVQAQSGEAGRDVLPFPTSAVRGAQALVAGRVSGAASTGHDFSPRFGSTPQGQDIIASDDLIRNIESTLESMQRRLDRVKREMNGSLKFPSPAPDDDDRPFAA